MVTKTAAAATTTHPTKNVGAWFRTHRVEAAGGGLVAVAGLALWRRQKGASPSTGAPQSTGVPVSGSVPYSGSSDGTGGTFTGGGGGDSSSTGGGLLAALQQLITGQQSQADTEASIATELGNIDNTLSSTGQAAGGTPSGGAPAIPKKTGKQLPAGKSKRAAHANPRPPARKPGKVKTPTPVAGHPGGLTMRAPVRAPGRKPPHPAPKPPKKAPKKPAPRPTPAEPGPVGNKPGRKPITRPVVKPKAAPKPPAKAVYV